jgi:LacI family transcriptional regulator
MRDPVASDGRRRPSMVDVAAAAGVSKGAVSKVIRNAYGVSPSMRSRVEAVIEELGYRPSTAARSMRGASFTIGLEIPQLGNDFYTQVMQGAGERLVGTGYQLIIAPGIGNVRGAPVLEALMDRQVDGIIAISPEVTPEWLEKRALQVPIVLLGRHDRAHNYDTVTNDDHAGVGLIMEHLRRLGHRRITHITVPPVDDVDGDREPHAMRLAAYRDAMRRDGLEERVELCLAFEDDAYRLVRRILESEDRPTAIFAGHDTLAIGALRAIGDLGLTSEDVSVAGYDDIDLAGHPYVSLTTVDQFGSAMGRAAATLLLERIGDGRTEPRSHQTLPELRVRDSTRPARG